MTTLDLAPAPGASPRFDRIANHAGMEARLLLRNGEQLILALVIPAGLLVAGRLAGGRLGLDAVTFPASVLALALWSTAFTSLAIATGFERRYGVLERLVATPLTRADLITGKALASAAIALGQVAVLSVLAFGLGWRPQPAAVQWAALLAGVPLAVVTFAGFALVLAGRLAAEVTLALANLVYLALAVGGGLVLPLAAHPSWAQPLVAALPTAQLGELLRAWAAGEVLLWPLAALPLWLALSLFLARKAFRWTS